MEALWNSVWISAASVVFSALIGMPLAFLFSRYDFPGRAVLGGLASLPVLLPAARRSDLLPLPVR